MLYHHRVIVGPPYGDGDEQMVLTPDRRVRPLSFSEASLMDIILYSGTLTGGMREEDC